MAEGNLNFAYGLFATAVFLLIFMPIVINFVVQPVDGSGEYADQLEELNNAYADFTGSAPVKEDIWVLSGVFLPYQNGGPSGFTPDGWLYGTEIHDYQPSQYSGGPTAYRVNNQKTIDGVLTDLDYYEYTEVGTAYAGLQAGDLYTNVALDVNQKSNIFFAPENKNVVNSQFYYDYSGYRYSFMPLVNVLGQDDNGNEIQWLRNQSSCSIVWYSYYNISEGLSGQLIVQAGDDRGTAYITMDTILRAFTSQNNTAKLALNFNGVSLNLYLRFDSYYTSSGMSLQECFKNGYWSIMITSESADSSAYLATDYQLNPESIFNTAVKLLTFNLDEYGFSPLVANLCSIIIVAPFYIGLLVIAMEYHKVLIFAGIASAIQAIATWGGFF